MPDHVLLLKVGSVCLIMRNLNIADGLVNGTKVIVTAISSRLITVRLPQGTMPICIPRIVYKFAFVEGSPLRVRRRQFPLVLAYAMTGHKSQGQTIEHAGVDLRTDCFTHGQLYVLLSRVRHPDHIVVLVHRKELRKELPTQRTLCTLISFFNLFPGSRIGEMPEIKTPRCTLTASRLGGLPNKTPRRILTHQ